MLRWVQILGALALLTMLASGRIAALRPHGRRIMLVMMSLYIAAGIAFVIWRVIVGPAAPLG